MEEPTRQAITMIGLDIAASVFQVHGVDARRELKRRYVLAFFLLPACLVGIEACMKGLGADFEEKHEPASDIDTLVLDSLKALDPKRPIREADITVTNRVSWFIRSSRLGLGSYKPFDVAAQTLK